MEAQELSSVTARTYFGALNLYDQYENIIATFTASDNGYRLMHACIAHLEQTGVVVNDLT